MSSVYSLAVLADTPQFYYRLNDSAGTTATDSSGNARHGTLFGVSSYGVSGAIVGDTDKGISFLAGGGVRVPYTTVRPYTWSAFTIEFWINLGNGWHQVVQTVDAGGEHTYLDGLIYTGGVVDGKVIDLYTLIGNYGSLLAAGSMDEISGYNYNIGAGKVLAHYLAATTIIVTAPPPPNAFKVTMAGQDITQYVQEMSMQIKETMGQGQGMASGGSSNSRAATAEFLAALGPAAQAVGAGTSVHSPQLVRGGEVIMYDNSNRKIFGGYVGKLTDHTDKKQIYTLVDCYDYWQELSRIQVQKVYSGVSDTYMVNDLLKTYVPWVDRSLVPTAGNYLFTVKNFKAITLQQALGQIADVTGFNMWISPDRRFHYVFPTNGGTAPFGLSDNPDQQTTFTYGWDSSNAYVVDDTATINRATFYGGKQPSNSFQQDLSTQANGSNRTFVLAFYPRSLANGTITVVSGNLMSGAALTVGYLLGKGNKNQFKSKGGTCDVLLNADAHTLMFDPGAAAPTNTGANSVYATYRYEFPMNVQITDPVSFRKFGKYYDGVISDQTVFDYATAVGRLRTLLNEQSNGLITIKVSCWRAGIQCGQLLNVVSSVRGVASSFMVQEVDVVPLGGGNFRYDITAGAWNWNLVDALLTASHAAFNAGINVNDTSNGQDVNPTTIVQDFETVKIHGETWTKSKTRTWGGYYARTAALSDGHDAYAGLFSIAS